MSGRRELSAADRALVLLALPSRTPGEVAALRRFFAALEAPGRAELAAKVAHNDVAPQVLLALEKEGLDPGLPAEVRAPWQARRDRIAALAADRVAEARELFRAMADRGIPVVVLKGMAFAELWGDPGYKKMNDLDILVRPEDVADLRELYRARGYLPLVLFEGGDPEQLKLEKTHHLPSYVSPDLRFVVGTHWGLCSPKKGLDLDHPRMWEESQPFDFHGAPARRLSAVDNLHHLAIHFHHYKTGLKELGDVFGYATRVPGGVDWDLLAHRIEAAGSASRAFYVFSLADALYPLGAPPGFLRRLEAGADAFARDEVALRLARPDLLLESRSLYEGEIEKAYVRYTLETRFHRKLAWFLRFFYRLVLPPAAVLRRTNVVDRVTRARYPGLLWANLRRTAREIGEGFGLAFFGLVCLKGLVELAGSLANYLRPPRRDPLAELREAAGGDPGALEELVDFLE